MSNDFSGFAKLAQDRNNLRAAWLKNLLTLATGALALLVALRPTAVLPIAQRHWLVAAWICLGSGIVFGAAATYSEVSLANRLTVALKDELIMAAKKTGEFAVRHPVVAKPYWIFRLAAWLMCVSLLGAVVSIVVYASLATLSN